MISRGSDSPDGKEPCGINGRVHVHSMGAPCVIYVITNYSTCMAELACVTAIPSGKATKCMQGNTVVA